MGKKKKKLFLYIVIFNFSFTHIMLCFFNGRCPTLNNRVSEFILYIILSHLKKNKLYTIDRVVFRTILLTTCNFLSKEEIVLIEKNLDVFYFRFTPLPVEFYFLNFLEKRHFLTLNHFINSFDVDKYICKKMNFVYWSFIDKNICNTIKYRKRTNITYEKRIKNLFQAIKNVTDIESMSHLLFYRYRTTLEPYFILHSLLHNLEPFLRIKFMVSYARRACTFNEKCRGGNVIISCKMTHPGGNYQIDYCLCKKHLELLKSNDLLSFK